MFIFETLKSINICFSLLLISFLICSKISRLKASFLSYFFVLFSTLPLFLGWIICLFMVFKISFKFTYFTNLNILILNLIFLFYIFTSLSIKIDNLKTKILRLKSSFSKTDKILISFFFIELVLLSTTPVKDSDSIQYHLGLANNYLNNIDIDQNILFSLIGYFEFFTILTLKNDVSNFISIHSVISFLILVSWILTSNNLLKEKDKKIILYFLISCPVVFYSLDSQKPFLIGIFIFIFLLLNFKLNKNFNFFLKYSLLCMIPLIKLNFLAPSSVLIIYFFIQDFNKNHKILIQSLKVISFSILLYLPIMLFKFSYFKNPISPFFYEFFDSEFSNFGKNLLFDAQTYVQGSIFNKGSILFQYLNLILDFSKPYTSLGLSPLIVSYIFIKVFTDMSNVKYFLLLVIILDLIFAPISARFFLTTFYMFLVFIYFEKDAFKKYFNNNLIINILRAQLLFIISIATVFNIVNFNIFLKDDLNAAIFTYDKAQKLNKEFSKLDKVMVDHPSIYYNFIYVPTYNLAYSSNAKDTKYIKNQINKGNIKYLASERKLEKLFTTKKNITLPNPLFSCFKYLKNISFLDATRLKYFKLIAFNKEIPLKFLIIYEKVKC